MEKQHLIWKSVELEDKLKIEDYKMTTGTTLQLVTAMRGGPLNIRRGFSFIVQALQSTSLIGPTPFTRRSWLYERMASMACQALVESALT